jgi:hypothetical protein
MNPDYIDTLRVVWIRSTSLWLDLLSFEEILVMRKAQSFTWHDIGGNYSDILLQYSGEEVLDINVYFGIFRPIVNPMMILFFHSSA